jgi:hypothetical protein
VEISDIGSGGVGVDALGRWSELYLCRSRGGMGHPTELGRTVFGGLGTRLMGLMVLDGFGLCAARSSLAQTEFDSQGMSITPVQCHDRFQ